MRSQATGSASGLTYDAKAICSKRSNIRLVSFFFLLLSNDLGLLGRYVRPSPAPIPVPIPIVGARVEGECLWNCWKPMILFVLIDHFIDDQRGNDLVQQYLGMENTPVPGHH